MKAGDNKVRVVDIPKNLPNPDNDIQTADTFRHCPGHVFPIIEVVRVEGKEFLQLDVGKVRGKAASMASIWIEPEYVEFVKGSGKAASRTKRRSRG